MFTQKADANRRSTPVGAKAMTRGVLNNTFIIAMRKRFLTTIRFAFLYIFTLSFVQYDLLNRTILQTIRRTIFNAKQTHYTLTIKHLQKKHINNI